MFLVFAVLFLKGGGWGLKNTLPQRTKRWDGGGCAAPRLAEQYTYLGFGL
jgi:hypothetical protein